MTAAHARRPRGARWSSRWPKQFVACIQAPAACRQRQTPPGVNKTITCPPRHDSPAPQAPPPPGQPPSRSWGAPKRPRMTAGPDSTSAPLGRRSVRCNWVRQGCLQPGTAKREKEVEEMCLKRRGRLELGRCGGKLWGEVWLLPRGPLQAGQAEVQGRSGPQSEAGRSGWCLGPCAARRRGCDAGGVRGSCAWSLPSSAVMHDAPAWARNLSAGSNPPPTAATLPAVGFQRDWAALQVDVPPVHRCICSGPWMQASSAVGGAAEAPSRGWEARRGGFQSRGKPGGGPVPGHACICWPPGAASLLACTCARLEGPVCAQSDLPG